VEPTAADAGIIDLMQVLKQSLEARSGRGATRARAGTARSATARKGPKRAPRKSPRTAKTTRARKRKAG
jgi:hypothetical protein